MTTVDQFLTHRRSGYFENFSTPHLYRPTPTDYLLVWVVEGELIGTIADRAFRATAGDVMIFEPGVSHSYSAPADGSWKWLWVHFSGTGAAELFTELCQTGQQLHVGTDEALYARFLDMLATARRPPSPGGSRRLAGELISVLTTISDLRSIHQTARRPLAGIAALYSWIEENIGQRITLSDLCELSGYSSAQLNRIFKADTGWSPMQHVARMRIATASWLLLETSLSVARIAELTGFDDRFHFSRRFTHLQPVSPRSFRTREGWLAPPVPPIPYQHKPLTDRRQVSGVSSDHGPRPFV